MDIRLGVDLGTTWTAAAVSNGASADAVQLGTHSSAMPSVLAVVDEQVVAGEAAERKLAVEPTAGVREFKRRLGDTTPYVLSGSPYGAEALMGHMLRHVVDAATELAGAAPTAVVLTHPANWGEYKLDLLREAARVADVSDVELLSEPEAAALHYVRIGKLEAGQVVAVYDFGGGTFDAAIVRCGEEGPELLGTAEGLERLGGVDLDQIVLAHVDETLDGKLREVDTTDADVRKAITRLRADCTAAKEALSTDTEAVIPVNLPNLQTEVRITRDEFEAAVRPRLTDTLAALDRTIASAGLQTSDIAGILLVGGSARMPIVAEQVAAHTGRPVLVDSDPKLVVALGAAGGRAVAAAPPAQVEDASGAEAAAAAAAEAAGGGKSGGKEKPGKQAEVKAGKGDRGAATARTAAAVGGVAAAGAAAAAGYMGYEHFIKDDDNDDEGGDDILDALGEEDGSLDVFEGLAEDLFGAEGLAGIATEAASAGPAEAATGLVGGFTNSPAGRVTASVFSSAPAAPSRSASAPAPQSRPRPQPAEQSTPPAPPPVFSDPEIEGVRAELRERLENWEPPEGADPEEVEKLRSDLEGLLNRYVPYPGQSVDDAIATLRYEFEDRVRDFAQDQQLDAIIEEELREENEAAEIAAEVDVMKDELRERLENWEPPHGADEHEVAELRDRLDGLLERYTAVPGMTAEQAMDQLRDEFNDAVGDFAQDLKIDALVEEARDEDAEDEDEHEEEEEARDEASPDDAGAEAPDEEHEEEDEDEEEDEAASPDGEVDDAGAEAPEDDASPDGEAPELDPDTYTTQQSDLIDVMDDDGLVDVMDADTSAEDWGGLGDEPEVATEVAEETDAMAEAAVEAEPEVDDGFLDVLGTSDFEDDIAGVAIGEPAPDAEIPAIDTDVPDLEPAAAAATSTEDETAPSTPEVPDVEIPDVPDFEDDSLDAFDDPVGDMDPIP